VHTNAGLCGDLISVGTVGTSYSTTGTALGTACGAFTPPRVPPESLRLFQAEGESWHSANGAACSSNSPRGFTGVRLSATGASMSSTYSTCSASICIDGQTTVNGDGSSETCIGMCHSSGPEPFLRLDFAYRRIVNRVIIYNRVNSWAGIMGRLGQHEVWVGDDPDSPTSNSLCSAKDDRSSVVVHSCALPLSGRYVFVLLPGADRILNLQEVEVYGEGAFMS
jgi:hypothetical protein